MYIESLVLRLVNDDPEKCNRDALDRFSDKCLYFYWRETSLADLISLMAGVGGDAGGTSEEGLTSGVERWDSILMSPNYLLNHFQDTLTHDAFEGDLFGDPVLDNSYWIGHSDPKIFIQ